MSIIKKKINTPSKAGSFRAGMITLLGAPNAGKSTLFNHLLPRPLAITSYKAQTTRHAILGIDQGSEYQAIYIDTPGYLDPHYPLQARMMQQLYSVLEGVDLMVWVVDIRHIYPLPKSVAHKIKESGNKLLILLNKCDLATPEEIESAQRALALEYESSDIMPCIATDPKRVQEVRQQLVGHLPFHSPYYDVEALTDRPQRFFVAELVRKAIYDTYQKEIPYSAHVRVENFKEDAALIRISVTIFVERESQKMILIGKGGGALKKMSIASREYLEGYLGKKVFLTQRIKVRRGWRKKENILNQLGY